MAPGSTRGRRRARIGPIIATIALIGAVVVTTAPASIGGTVPTCKVKNLSTGQRYAGGGEALANAIDEAVSGNRLQIKGTCVGNYALEKNLRLIGENSAALGPPTLDGNGDLVLLVESDVTAKVVDLTIKNGTGTLGGGIFNNGTLKINSSTVTGNTALLGGGIFNGLSSTLTINRSTVSGNTSEDSTESTIEGGGGIYNRPNATLTINRSTVSGNTSATGGGGIHVEGTVTVNRSQVSGNVATDTGGGFDISGSDGPGGNLTLNLTTVTGNTAGTDGGGIHNLNGSLTLISSTVTGNTPNDCVGAGCP